METQLNFLIHWIIFTYFMSIFFTEAKKEEKKAESESDDDDMGFGLFD